MLHQRTHHTLAISYGVPVRDMDTWTHGKDLPACDTMKLPAPNAYKSSDPEFMSLQT